MMCALLNMTMPHLNISVILCHFHDIIKILKFNNFFVIVHALSLNYWHEDIRCLPPVAHHTKEEKKILHESKTLKLMTMFGC